MNTLRTALLIPAVWLLILGADVAGASQADETQQALEALKACARAYRAVPALRDTFTYVVKGPNMDREPKKIEARLGPGTDASVADALLQAVALGHAFYVTKSDSPGKYVARPYSGDFGKTLASIVGNQSSLFEPVQIAMRSGKDPDSWVDSLRFNLLGPLRITGFKKATGDNGPRFDEIYLSAENGHEELRLDARTHFVSSVQLSVQPPGAPSGVFVEIRGDFAPEVLKRTAGVVAFDPGARRAVPEVGDLTFQVPPGPFPQHPGDSEGGSDESPRRRAEIGRLRGKGGGQVRLPVLFRGCVAYVRSDIRPSPISPGTNLTSRSNAGQPP